MCSVVSQVCRAGPVWHTHSRGVCKGGSIFVSFAGTSRQVDPCIFGFADMLCVVWVCVSGARGRVGRPDHVCLMPGVIGAHRARHLFQNNRIGLEGFLVSVACEMGGVWWMLVGALCRYLYIYICQVLHAATNHFCATWKLHQIGCSYIVQGLVHPAEPIGLRML